MNSRPFATNDILLHLNINKAVSCQSGANNEIVGCAKDKKVRVDDMKTTAGCLKGLGLKLGLEDTAHV